LSGVVQTVAVGYPSESGNSSSVGVQVVVIDNAPSEYAAIEAAPRSLAASPHMPDIASEHAERTQTEVVPAEATIAPHHVDCEIILSDGVRSRPRELPETEHCSDKPAAHRVALSPPVPEAPSRAREKLKSPAERLGDVTDEQYSFPKSTAQPTPGLVQEYGASDEPPFGSATASDLQATESAEPRRPELRLRRSLRTTRHAQRAPAVTAAATAPGATESRTLSLLAVFGGLLTLAALLYIVGDLVSWF
jgi:hypothetical protein